MMKKRTPWLWMLSLALPVAGAAAALCLWKGQMLLDAIQVALKMVVIP